VAGSRYVVLGLAQARSAWFRDVAQWANASSVPAEFVKCVSGEEVRARLAGGRPFSALLVDAGLTALDRDLIDAARTAGCAVIVVGGGRATRDWTGLGAAALLPAHFDRKDLLDTLAAHATMIGRADRPPDHAATGEIPGWQAPIAAVTGPGGTGASTAAVALAQGIAGDVRSRGGVLLVDLCLHAEQAMLHDARDVVPGIQELVDVFRSGRPSGDELRSLTFAVPERGYSVLLGLRRSRSWSTLRPRAFEAALDGLRRSHRAIVADVDHDLEGEEEGGSIDVEERHVMSRTAVGAADAVFAVGRPGLKGLHALARVIGEVLAFGVPGERVVPVINQAPRNARLRAELTHALSQLLPAWAGAGMVSPLFLPERRVDDAFRDGIRLPDALVSPLVGAWQAVRARADHDARRPVAPQLVTPGSLGAWTPEPA